MGNKFVIGGVVLVAAGSLVFGGVSRNDTPARVSADNAAETLAPDFTLQKLGGGTISLSEFLGRKPVVVDFWASWCPNCQRDMPNLNRFYEQYKDKVEVIGVNLQEKESAIKDFIASRGISFPIALDPHGQASNAFGVRYTNTHFLIDEEGNLVRTIPGDISEADIESLINETSNQETQSAAPDKEPCEVAQVENGGGAGVCENEKI